MMVGGDDGDIGAGRDNKSFVLDIYNVAPAHPQWIIQGARI